MGLLMRDGGSAVAGVRPKAASYRTERPITAAAQKITINDRQEMQRAREVAANNLIWQTEAWDYYDAIGEVKYTFNLLGNITSRVRLYAALPDAGGAVPKNIADDESIDDATKTKIAMILTRLRSARGGQAALIRNAAINLSVAGECYLVRRDPKPGEGNIGATWDIRSVDELSIDGSGKMMLRERRDQRQPEQMASNAYVARLWRQHPRFTDEAESSMRGLLDPCAELTLINRTFRATARSRLNAGAMYLPDGLSAATADEVPEELLADGMPPESDEFENELLDAMTTPIKDEDSASAVVPLIIRGPAELGEKIKIFKFERSFDPALADRADRLLERILQGIDAPKDIVTGLANVKYSNAVQITESLYKSHIEPLAMLICDALTTAYLRPHLIAAGIERSLVERIVVWYDPSDIAMRPDQADDANEGYDRHLLSGAAWRRAHGFSDVDKPTVEETVFRAMLEKGQILPELMEALLQKFAPTLMGEVKEEQAANSESPLPANVQKMLDGQTPSPTEDSAPPPQPEAPTQNPTSVPPAVTEALQ